METRSCGSFKGVRVQVAGLVATPGGSSGRDQILWKLSGVEVQVAGFVTQPGGSWDGNQVLWKLQKGHPPYRGPSIGPDPLGGGPALY